MHILTNKNIQSHWRNTNSRTFNFTVIFKYHNYIIVKMYLQTSLIIKKCSRAFFISFHISNFESSHEFLSVRLFYSYSTTNKVFALHVCVKTIWKMLYLFFLCFCFSKWNISKYWCLLFSICKLVVCSRRKLALSRTGAEQRRQRHQR